MKPSRLVFGAGPGRPVLPLHPFTRRTKSWLLRARVILPISAPAIADGAVLITGRRIRAVAPAKALRTRAEVVDLGDTILLPGLVNGHCHLDYTHMAGHFPPPKLFTDWLKAITEEKSGWSFADFVRSWRAGAEMLVRTGTTTVADIEALPQLLPEVWDCTPLRVFSFLEMIGITARRPPSTVLQEALDKLPSLHHSRCRAGLSPHAPYSTVLELLRLSGKAARKARLPVCVHVAESALEAQMFKRRGEMFRWIRHSGRDMADCDGCSPVEHLHRARLLGSNVLATHANYLSRSDPALLASRGVHVVHCPRSHHYFRHRTFPIKRLLRAGVNVCLGTDSLASVCKSSAPELELNMFDEMRCFAANHPTFPPGKILKMATVNGARALGLADEVGEIKVGAFADLITLPFSGSMSYACEAVLHHKGPVAASMIDGVWAIPPDGLPATSSYDGI